MNGVLIYAFNNDRIDYFKQAVWCGDRVNRFLNLPVTIVTDVTSHHDRASNHSVVYTEAKSGGNRVFNPSIRAESDVWFNANRFQSYDLSPYDQTIVLDSDYVVCSDVLLTLFDSNLEVAAIKNVYDATNRDGFKNYTSISNGQGLHHYWATVLYFKKGQFASDFFDLMTMIKENYPHYADLFKFRHYPFRNDFAVSIALNTMYGHTPDAIPVIPWKMANLFNDVEIIAIDDITFELHYSIGLDKEVRKTKISGQDFHFMNKINLAQLYEN